MPDNFVPSTDAGLTYASDEIAGSPNVQWAYSKMAWGAPNTATPVDATAANALPVQNLALGGTADSSASSDTGTFSLTALIKRLLSKQPALGPAAGTAATPIIHSNALTVTGPAAQTAVQNNALDAGGSAPTDTAAYQSGVLEVTSTGTGGTWILEQSLAGTTWTPCPMIETSVANPSPIVAAVTATSSTRMFRFSNLAPLLRLRIATTITGGSIQARANLSQMPFASPVLPVVNATAANLAVTASIAATQTLATVTTVGTVTTCGTVTTVGTLTGGGVAEDSASTANPVITGGIVRVATIPTTLVQGDAARLTLSSAAQLVTKPYAGADTDWQFTGVLTTAVASLMRAAGAAGVRNYCTGISYQNTNATATTVLIQDNVTTIAQFNAPATMLEPAVIPFPTPIRGTAATALNVIAGTTGANVLVNAQGYQSA